MAREFSPQGIHVVHAVIDNVPLACYARGLMINGNWQAALYVDERADENQFDALVQIFGGKKGGHPAVLMSLVGEVLGISRVKIDFEVQGNSRTLVIPGIAEAEIVGIQGITGADSKIGTPPLCVVTSHPSVVACSKNYLYRDHGRQWEFSERNGFYSEFVYRP